MTYAERIATARAICEYLGEGWDVDGSVQYRDHPGAFLNHVDGRRLYVRDGLIICGIYPPHGAYGVHSPSINVNAARGPATVAKEIRRRLLPDYESGMVKVREWIARDEQERQARTEIASRVCEALPGSTIREDTRNDFSTITLRVPGAKYRCELELTHDATEGSITLQYVPIDTARRVVAALAANIHHLDVDTAPSERGDRDGEQAAAWQAAFLAKYDGILKTALEVYARHMDEAAAESRTGYEQIKDDPAARAAQDESWITTQGLRHAADMLTDCATTARAALGTLYEQDDAL